MDTGRKSAVMTITINSPLELEQLKDVNLNLHLSVGREEDERSSNALVEVLHVQVTTIP